MEYYHIFQGFATGILRKLVCKEVKNMTEKKQSIPLPTEDDFRFTPIDPQGSYTGVPEEINEIPIQDADDL